MNENEVKSQFFITLINYLLIELIKRKTSKKTIAFSNLTEKVRLCLCHYLLLNYLCIEIKEGVRKVNLKSQTQMDIESDLFY